MDISVVAAAGHDVANYVSSAWASKPICILPVSFTSILDRVCASIYVCRHGYTITSHSFSSTTRVCKSNRNVLLISVSGRSSREIREQLLDSRRPEACKSWTRLCRLTPHASQMLFYVIPARPDMCLETVSWQSYGKLSLILLCHDSRPCALSIVIRSPLSVLLRKVKQLVVFVLKW